MSNQQEKIFNQFLGENKILIVDKNNISRSRLKKSLLGHGAKAENVFTTAEYSEALKYIHENQPQIVLSDYLIKGGSGFDLFKEYKGHYPKLKKIITILITSNVNQSVVAKAAEEDVDSFLIKPYTAKSLHQNMSNTVYSKLHPTNYVKKIEQGKELLFIKEYDKAKDTFAKASEMVKEPSLALFYKGQAEYLMELTQEAEGDYKKGLDVNKIHFKCQVGLYEVLRDQKRSEEAYEVVRNLSKYFPANPERLAEVIRLCIVTENYQDMLEYYQLFLNLDHRAEELQKFVAAGMYIAGKYQYLNNHIDSAFIYFEKTAVSFSKNVKIINEIIELLLEKKIFEKAEAILARYPLGLGDGSFEVYEYIIKSRKYQAFERIHKGELIFKGKKPHYDATIILLKAYLEKNDQASFDKCLTEAKSLWPSIGNEFQKAA